MDKNRIPTIKQGKEFMNKVRELEKKDIEKCSNLMLLLAEAVCKNKKIDYSKCINKYEKEIKKI